MASTSFDSSLPSKDLKVALFPMEIVWHDKCANLDTLINAMPSLYEQIDLLILPETFSTGFLSDCDPEVVKRFAERNSGDTIQTVKALAKEYGIAIAGSFVANTGGLLYNRAFFIESDGEEHFADKRHLFSLGGEDKIFRAGDKRMSIRFRGWNISMVVCYDVRFPVWCRNYGENHYDLLIAVANWPVSRIEAWNQLLKARAIENQAYVCGVNCKGTDRQGSNYDGSSPVYNYIGKEIGINSPDSPFIYAALNAEKLRQFREKFPAWRDADNFMLL